MALQPRCPKRRCFLSKPFASVPSVPTPRFPAQTVLTACTTDSQFIFWVPSHPEDCFTGSPFFETCPNSSNRTQDLYHLALPCSMLDHQAPPNLKCHPQSTLRGKSQPNSKHPHPQVLPLSGHLSCTMLGLLLCFVFSPIGHVSPNSV